MKLINYYENKDKNDPDCCSDDIAIQFGKSEIRSEIYIQFYIPSVWDIKDWGIDIGLFNGIEHLADVYYLRLPTMMVCLTLIQGI